MQAVGLRETARRVGVSATAAYRHFTSKEDLLASVAAEGFRELGAAMEGATRGPNPLTRAGLAYIEFAQPKPRPFSPDVRARPGRAGEISGASGRDHGVEALLLRGVADLDQRPFDHNLAAMGAWGLVHGLSYLVVDGFIPAARATSRAEEILAGTRLPRASSTEPAR